MKLLTRLSQITTKFLLATSVFYFPHVDALTIKLQPDRIAFIIKTSILPPWEYVSEYVTCLTINGNQVFAFSPGLLSEPETVYFQLAEDKKIQLPEHIDKRLSQLLLPNGESNIQYTLPSNLSAETFYAMHPPEQFIMMHLGFGFTEHSNNYELNLSEVALPHNSLSQCITDPNLNTGSVVTLSGKEEMDKTMIMHIGNGFFLRWDYVHGSFYIRTAAQIDEDQKTPVEYALLIQCYHWPVTLPPPVELMTMLFQVFRIWQSYHSAQSE